MSLSIPAFFLALSQYPALLLFSLLLLAVILVNGWTDAPNAIATAVASGAISFRRAVAMAALCNLAGVFCAALWCPAVAMTVSGAADFGRDPPRGLRRPVRRTLRRGPVGYGGLVVRHPHQ